MVDILGRMKVMEKMREILEEMHQESLITLDTIAKVMRRFVGARQWKDVVRIFDDLKFLGLEKNTKSMNVDGRNSQVHQIVTSNKVVSLLFST